MTMSIAEKFLVAFNYGDGKDEKLKAEFFRWLQEQPENQKMFTLEEVEATAREAWHKGISESSQHYFFYHWWSDKKQELVK